MAWDGRPATASEMVAFTGASRDGLAAAPADVITVQSTKPHIPTNAARNRAMFPIETPRTSALRNHPECAARRSSGKLYPPVTLDDKCGSCGHHRSFGILCIDFLSDEGRPRYGLWLRRRSTTLRACHRGRGWPVRDSGAEPGDGEVASRTPVRHGYGRARREGGPELYGLHLQVGMGPVVNQMDGFSGRAREGRHEDWLFARPIGEARDM